MSASKRGPITTILVLILAALTACSSQAPSSPQGNPQSATSIRPSVQFTPRPAESKQPAPTSAKLPSKATGPACLLSIGEVESAMNESVPGTKVLAVDTGSDPLTEDWDSACVYRNVSQKAMKAGPPIPNDDGTKKYGYKILSIEVLLSCQNDAAAGLASASTLDHIFAPLGSKGCWGSFRIENPSNWIDSQLALQKLVQQAQAHYPN